MTPATLASIARLIPAPIALTQIAAPVVAINSLLAVTTDLPLAIATLTISAATPVPPTNSATISTLGSATTARQSVVRFTTPSPPGNLRAATPRLHTARTSSGKPSFCAICAPLAARIASVPEPTLPRPTMPIRTARPLARASPRGAAKTSCINGYDTSKMMRQLPGRAFFAVLALFWLAVAQETDMRGPRMKREQMEALLKHEHKKSLDDAAELIKLSEELKIELEKNDQIGRAH